MSKVIPTTAKAVACSPKRPNDAADSSLSIELEARALKLEPGVYVYPIGQGLAPAEIERIDRVIGGMDARLADLVPDDGGRIVEQVAAQVHHSFKARDISATVQQVYDGFLIALPGRSSPAVREALRRLIRDEAPPELSRTFAPTPGDLAKLARAIEAEWRLERNRFAWLRDIREQRPAVPEPQPSPEEMAEVRERARRLVAGVAGRRGMPPARVEREPSEEDRAALLADLAARKARNRERGEA